MEPKFINQYTITIEMLKEWAAHPVGHSAINQRKKGITLRILGLICSCIIGMSGFLLHEYLMIAMGVVFGVLFLLRLFVIPNRIIKKQYALILKSQNRSQLVRTIIFSDQIVIEDGKSTTRNAYSELVKIMEDKHYFYLFFNEDIALRVRKNGFTLGTCDDFRQFIHASASPAQ